MDCVILAAGLGERTKLNYPKQLMRLGSKPLLIHTLDIFLSMKEIDNIVVTVIPEYISDFKFILGSYYNKLPRIKLVAGGKTRQESVYNALNYVVSDRVIIHEAVRPFINKKHILDLINTLGDVVIPAIPLIPTIYNIKGFFENRNQLLNIQLPQVFTTKILKYAHKKAREIYNEYSDDSSLVFAEERISPAIVQGLEENFKITTALDVKLAEVLYEELNSCNWWQ